MDIKTYPLTDDEVAARMKAALERALKSPVCPACNRQTTMGRSRTGYTLTPKGIAALRAWEARQ